MRKYPSWLFAKILITICFLILGSCADDGAALEVADGLDEIVFEDVTEFDDASQVTAAIDFSEEAVTTESAADESIVTLETVDAGYIFPDQTDTVIEFSDEPGITTIQTTSTVETTTSTTTSVDPIAQVIGTNPLNSLTTPAQYLQVNLVPTAQNLVANQLSPTVNVGQLSYTSQVIPGFSGLLPNILPTKTASSIVGKTGYSAGFAGGITSGIISGVSGSLNLGLQTFFSGKYLFKLTGSTSPSVVCSFDKQQAKFDGCDSYAFPYTAHSSGFFKISNIARNTKRSCAINYDNDFITIFNYADSFKKTSKGINFFKGGKQIAEFEGPISSISKIKNLKGRQSFINSIPQGNYKFSILGSKLAAVQTLVGRKGFQFLGCNTVGVLCNSHFGSRVKAPTRLAWTKNKCKTDNDQQYVQALRGVNGFERNGNNFYLTSNKKRVASFERQIPKIAVKNTQSILKPLTVIPQVGISSISNILDIKKSIALPIVSAFASLKGKYKLSITGSKSSPLPCDFDDKQITLSGCNTFTIPYDAHIDGYFKSSQHSLLTKKNCGNNIDNEFLSALKGVERYQRDSRGISFLKGGKEIARCSL